MKISGLYYYQDHPAKIAIEEYNMDMEVRYIPSDFDEVAKRIMPNAVLQSTGLVGLRCSSVLNSIGILFYFCFHYYLLYLLLQFDNLLM